MLFVAGDSWRLPPDVSNIGHLCHPHRIPARDALRIDGQPRMSDPTGQILNYVSFASGADKRPAFHDPDLQSAGRNHLSPGGVHAVSRFQDHAGNLLNPWGSAAFKTGKKPRLCSIAWPAETVA